MPLRIEGGTLRADAENRTLKGMLLPFGVLARSNLGRFTVDAGAFKLPEDPSVITLNLRHRQDKPIGRATEIAETPEGITATFSVAKTPEGDQYLADAAAGTLACLSAEVSSVIIEEGAAVSGNLFGAAAVENGAFEGAKLLAAFVDDPADELVVDGVKYKRVEDVPTPATEANPTPSQKDTTVTEPVLNAALPTALTLKAAETKPKSLFATLGAAQRGERNPLLAALAETTVSDVNDGLATQWLGEVAALGAYTPRYSDLLQTAPLAGLTAVGFRIVDKPVVEAYAGFPASPASETVTTESVILTAHRIAGAVSFDRALLDIPSGGEVYQAILRELARAYAVKSDKDARDFIAASATAVAGGSVPVGGSRALAALIDGVQAIVDAERSTPSFAIVGSDLYRDLLLQRQDAVAAHLSASIGLSDGTLAGFRIRSSSAPAFMGKVTVGTSDAMTRYELAGAPVRVDVASIQTGGIEQGLFGYEAHLLRDAKGIVAVTPGA